MVKRQSVRQEERWNEAEARRWLDAWRASGENLTGFARARGVSRYRLDWWKRKLGIPFSKGGAVVPVVAKASVPGTVPVIGSAGRSQSGGFVEVKLSGVPGVPGASRPVVHSSKLREIEVRTVRGHRLRVPVGFDSTTLRRVLDVLGEVD